MCFEPEVIWRYSILTSKKYLNHGQSERTVQTFLWNCLFWNSKTLKFNFFNDTFKIIYETLHLNSQKFRNKSFVPRAFFIGSMTCCGVVFFYFSYFWCFFVRAHLKEYSHDWILMNSFESLKIHFNQCLKPKPLLWPKLYIILKVKNNLSMWVIWWFIM